MATQLQYRQHGTGHNHRSVILSMTTALTNRHLCLLHQDPDMPAHHITPEVAQAQTVGGRIKGAAASEPVSSLPGCNWNLTCPVQMVSEITDSLLNNGGIGHKST